MSHGVWRHEDRGLALQRLNGLTGAVGQRVILLEDENVTCDRLDCIKHYAAVAGDRFPFTFTPYGMREQECDDTRL